MIYRRILRLYLPYIRGIAGATGLMLLSIGFNLLKPWPVKWMIDTVLPQAASGVIHSEGFTLTVPGAFLAAAVAVVVIAAGAGLFHLLQSYLFIRIGLKTVLHLRTQLYTYLQHLPLHFHDTRRSGETTYRVAYDSQSIETFLNRGVTGVLSGLFTLVGAVIVLARMDGMLALLAIAVAPLFWATAFFFARRVRAQTTRVQQEESQLLARTTEGLSTIRITHAFGQEEYEIREFSREASDSLTANLDLTMTQVVSTFIIGMIMAGGTATILYYGGGQVLEGKLKPGDLWIFLSYLAMLHQPLEQLSYTSWALEGAAAGAQRVFEVLDAGDDVPESPNAVPMTRGPGAVTFQDVQFSYEERKPILRGITLEVKPGQFVGIVGPSGSGKTTLLSIIPRFYDPTKGAVLVDGQDVRGVTKKSLRDNLAFVLQDTLLLSGTVRDNIAYGRPGATKKEIVAAAKAAQAHEFITGLPRGYETQVGERGVRLSGGQRQRIGIARAFLKNAPILLLDEPTSALDGTTEAELMTVLKTLVQRQTTIMVSQRLFALHEADCIYVLDQGRIVESGKGPDLLAKNGIYARLWRDSHSA